MVKYFEKFNQHRLNYVIENKEKFSVKVYDDDYNPFLIPKKYLLKSTKGVISVSYHQPHNRNFGRFFANDSISLQSFAREIRHTIASEFYDDVDIVNCHPIILRHLCNKYDVPCDRLNDYIENRDEHLTDLMKENKIDRDDAKQVFLSIINNGSRDYRNLENPTKFVKRFKRELSDILEELVEQYPSEHEKRKKLNPENAIGSTINAIMCDMENQILQCILKFYKDASIITDNCVLCFDGVMIPKHKNTESLIPDCEKYILEKTNITINLKIKPMDEGFELPAEIPNYTEHTNFDPKDEFCFLEFDEKWRGRHFISENEIIEQTRNDLNRVFCRVEQGGGFIVKKTDCDDNLYDILDRNCNFSDMYFTYSNPDGSMKEMSFKRYLQVFSNYINRYRAIDFAPNNNDPKLFNLWSGYKAHKLNYDLDITPIQLILQHIKEVYCNGCDISYEYFLDLLYFILKYPEKPLGVATFLYSNKQGSGKNVILDFLQKYVFGDTLTYYTTGLENVLEKHNHMLKNKKVVVVDELASAQDTFHGNFDKLKSMMTGGSIVINPKGVNQYSIKNVLGWFLISNNEDCLKIESSDRRYFCLNVSEKYVGNKKYFKSLTDTFTQDNGNLFYTYILNRGNERDINIRIPPINAFKRELITKSWSNSVRFLFDLKCRLSNENDDDCDDEPNDDEEGNSRYVSSSKLFHDYTEWCSENRERVKTATRFGTDIKNYITKTRKTGGYIYDLESMKF